MSGTCGGAWRKEIHEPTSMTARGHARLRREGKMRWINPVSDDASDKEQAGARPTPRPRALPQNTKTSHPQPTGRPRPPFPAAPDRPQAYGRSEVTEGRGRRGETESITCSSCGIVRNGGEPTEHRAGRNLIWRRKADFARPHGAAHVVNLHGQARPCSVRCGDHGPGWMTTEFRMQLPRDLHETGFSCPEYRSGPGACRRTGCVVG